MPIVRATASEYLLTGRAGRLQNRGSAVQAFLLPGTVYVLVPAAKQEATFEFTQETKDGIPLRFKGIVVYRITEPVAAAGQFDFAHGDGTSEISTLLTHVCLGELRHAVSHMSMVECIEGRKTALSAVVAAALDGLLAPAEGDGRGAWGITIEVAQVAQVFIVDPELRAQLEAEVRNDIRLRSDQSGVRSAEALELARLTSERRLQAERVANERNALKLELERVQAQVETEQERVNAETPMRLLKIAREAEVLREDLALRRLQGEVEALEVERRLLLPRAEQALRREILPLEQAPEIVAAAAQALHGTNLSIYGEGAELVGHLAPLMNVIAESVRRSTASPGAGPGRGSGTPA